MARNPPRAGIAAAVLFAGLLPAAAAAQEPDPRIGLGAGWLDAETASSNMELRAHRDRPAGFFDPSNPGAFGFLTSDLALGGDHAFMGSFHGFTIWDISDPANRR